jgi:diguanylate cyclase (GGDEF)-like protein/PAS domain S-box-containing protein
MDDVVFLIDTAGRLTEFHWPAVTDYARPEPGRFLGRDYGDAFPAEANAAIGDAIAGLMVDPQPRRADLVLVPGDPPRHFQATFSAISDGSPWPQGFLCVARDVTEARRREARNQLLVAALEAAANGILITGRDAVIEWVNPAFSALTGYSREEAIGRRPALVKSGLHDDSFYQALWQTILGGQVWQGEVVNRRKNGQLYHEELTITPVRDDQGHIHHFIAIKQDISARKAEEEAARLARAEIERLSQRNELLLNSAGEGIFGTDLAGRATFINPAALTMLGFEREEVIGRNQHELFHHHHADGSSYPAEECPVFRTLHDGVHREVEDAFVRKSGEAFPVLLTVTPMVENGQRVGVEVVFQDIAARKAMEQELRRLATTDFLTGVANRRHFMERLELELERIRRFGRPAALLMVDLDHFKAVNDTHGHAVGDAVLRHFASLAQHRLRRIDLLGRLGGEEFAILLPGTERAGAREFAEAFRRQVEATPAQSDKGPIPFTVSIGIADIDPIDAQADALLARADDRLYAAKQKGRNRVEGDPA